MCVRACVLTRVYAHVSWAAYVCDMQACGNRCVNVCVCMHDACRMLRCTHAHFEMLTRLISGTLLIIDQGMDGEAVAAGFASSPGADCLNGNCLKTSYETESVLRKELEKEVRILGTVLGIEINRSKVTNHP